MFRKGEKESLCKIRRRKAWANKQQTAAAAAPQEFDEDQRSSSTSSSSGYGSLIDENKRLKKENGVLNSELTSMKRKCKELLDLVAKYSHSDKEEEDERPKLFGVRLEVQGEREMKRRRAEIRESASILLSQSCKQVSCSLI
jgi:heat shock transcription factor